MTLKVLARRQHPLADVLFQAFELFVLKRLFFLRPSRAAIATHAYVGPTTASKRRIDIKTEAHTLTCRRHVQTRVLGASRVDVLVPRESASGLTGEATLQPEDDL